MANIAFQQADDIVKGRPSWWVVRDGVRCERVWRDVDDTWTAADLGGECPWALTWDGMCRDLGLPADTPEPVVRERGETVEVRIGVMVADRDDWAADSDADALERGFRDYDKPTRFSWVTARVPLPAKPAEVVGEVSDG